MWATVVLMALVAGRGPARIAAVIVISSKSRPVRLLAAYLVGGFGVSLIVGAMVLFVLEGMGVGLRRGLPPTSKLGLAYPLWWSRLWWPAVLWGGAQQDMAAHRRAGWRRRDRR